MKSSIEYEMIIKGLIDANIRQAIDWESSENDEINEIRFMDKIIEFTFHCKTNRQVIIDYFYHQIMKWEPNKVKSEDYIIPPENGLNDKSLNELQEILDKTGTMGYMGEDC